MSGRNRHKTPGSPVSLLILAITMLGCQSLTANDQPGRPQEPTAANSSGAVPTKHVAVATPYVVGGKHVGYRLRAGSDPAAFRAAGLIPHDLLMEVDGRTVTTNNDIAEFLNRLARGEAMTVKLLRAGEATEVELNSN